MWSSECCRDSWRMRSRPAEGSLAISSWLQLYLMAVGWWLPCHMIRDTYEESQTEPVSHAGKPILVSAPRLLVIDPPNKSCRHGQLCPPSLCFASSTDRLFMCRCSAASHTQALQAHFVIVLTKAQVHKDVTEYTALQALVHIKWVLLLVFLDKAQVKRGVITTL